MKRTLQILLGLSLLMTMVYSIVSTPGLLVGLLVVVSILILLGVFFAGVYVARDMMRQGADLVLRGQKLNDQYDALKMAGLANFGREITRIKANVATVAPMNGQPQYPALPAFSTLEGDFSIAGLEDEEIESKPVDTPAAQ
jgi:hypothetical protein